MVYIHYFWVGNSLHRWTYLLVYDIFEIGIHQIQIQSNLNSTLCVDLTGFDWIWFDRTRIQIEVCQFGNSSRLMNCSNSSAGFERTAQIVLANSAEPLLHFSSARRTYKTVLPRNTHKFPSANWWRIPVTLQDLSYGTPISPHELSCGGTHKFSSANKWLMLISPHGITYESTLFWLQFCLNWLLPEWEHLFPERTFRTEPSGIEAFSGYFQKIPSCFQEESAGIHPEDGSSIPSRKSPYREPTESRANNNTKKTADTDVVHRKLKWKVLHSVRNTWKWTKIRQGL